MLFAHLSDCHIGSWQRHPKLSGASTAAFKQAMELCIQRNVDFILISGDLFDTAVPNVDSLKEAVLKLKQVKDSGIPVYVIPGSHDYSHSGRTMLDVLEGAGLFVNVAKKREEGGKLTVEFTEDAKTGAKIAGLPGLKGGLERSYYLDLFREQLEAAEGFKIFMLHSGIEEFKPPHLEQMEAIPLAFFPKGFNYYAAGHIHHQFSARIKDYGLIAFPGPGFPNSFDELERLGHGGFYIVEAADEIKLEHVPLSVHDFASFKLDCSGMTPREVEAALLKRAATNDFEGAVVGLRLSGTIKGGRTSEIRFREIFESFYSAGAYCILKNTHSLSSEFFQEVKSQSGSVEDIESGLINEHAGKLSSTDAEFTKSLLSALSAEKEEGERQADFESRLMADFDRLLSGLKL